jgi:hypothetical protein
MRGNAMNSHATAYGLILGALVACGGASAAPAPGANTSGLTLAISKVALNQKQVTIQFTLKNNGKGRAYFFNARGDRRESGFFGSGEQMNQPPHLTGINSTCDDNLEHCLSPGFTRDLARFSYVEPGDMTVFSMTWLALSTVSDKDTFSFMVPLVVRLSSENGDPGQAGAPKGAQFNFPSVNLDRDN